MLNVKTYKVELTKREWQRALQPSMRGRECLKTPSRRRPSPTSGCWRCSGHPHRDGSHNGHQHGINQ
jgi:hypothetical protein